MHKTVASVSKEVRRGARLTLRLRNGAQCKVKCLKVKGEGQGAHMHVVDGNGKKLSFSGGTRVLKCHSN